MNHWLLQEEIKMISFTLNGLDVSVEEGTTLLEAAKFARVLRELKAYVWITKFKD